MAKKYERFWYIDSNRIGIVEKATKAQEKDGWQSNYKSISEAKDIRIYAISKSTDLTLDDLTADAFVDIPEQFHEGIVYRAIATFYKDPRNQDMNNAQLFDAEYELKVREARKYSRSRYVTTGFLKPQDF